MKKILALFPGQGSQKVGMGAELVQEFELARDLFSVADQSLGFALSQICLNGPAEDLQKTEITQPAILAVSTIYFRLAEQIYGAALPIVAAAGHSLGEYSALVAAGAVDFEEAVRLVHKRGKYMQEAVPEGAGKMVAVLGVELDQLEAKIDSYQGKVQIANVNAPGQIVVAGEQAAVSEFQKELTGVKTVELAVSAPFHCQMMKPAEERLEKELAKLSISKPRFPVFSNFLGKIVDEPEEIRTALVNQVCGRVRWTECIQNAIKVYQPELAIEFGNGTVLTGMLKRIEPQLARANINCQEALRTVSSGLPC